MDSLHRLGRGRNVEGAVVGCRLQAVDEVLDRHPRLERVSVARPRHCVTGARSVEAVSTDDGTAGVSAAVEGRVEVVPVQQILRRDREPVVDERELLLAGQDVRVPDKRVDRRDAGNGRRRDLGKQSMASHAEFIGSSAATSPHNCWPRPAEKSVSGCPIPDKREGEQEVGN